MKGLLVVFCVCALAIATPNVYEFAESDEIIPELPEISKAPSPVIALQSQFDELQTQMKAGTMVTPQVKTTIDKMIKLVEEEVEPAIQDAHKADQEVINTSMDAVTNLNIASALTKNSLDQRASELRSTISKHNNLATQLSAAATAFSNSVTSYQTIVLSKTSKCCEYQDAAVPDIEYTPAYAKCDYSSSTDDDCLKAADAAVDSALRAKFTAGYSEYLGLQQACATQTTSVTAAETTMRTEDGKCDAKVVAVQTEYEIADESMPTLKTDWATAHNAYKAEYSNLTSAYNSMETNVRTQETDRQKEWEATQEIKCLLVHYKDGGLFDDAAVTTCNSVISPLHLVITYPTAAPLTVWVLGEFDELQDTSADETSCMRVENANEAADNNCEIKPANSIPVCQVV